MNLFKTFGLVEEVPDAQPTKQQAAPAPQVQSGVVNTPSFAATPAASLTVNTGVPTQKYIDHFQQILDDTKVKNPAVDYYAFKKAFDNTAASQSSVMENIRYQLIFSTLQPMGLSKEQLLSSAKTYLDAIAADNESYQQKSTQTKATEVNTRQTQIDALNKGIDEKNQKIQDLLKEIATDTASVGTLKNEIIDQTNTIDQKQKNFTVTYESVKTTIENDINKIQTYLQ